MKYDVFISYSSKNAPTAQAICHELEDNGIRCWMAPRDIPVGSKYATVITQAIKECKAVVLVFSEQSAISPWVESEINIAFSNRKPIIPYKIDLATLENYDEFYLMLNNRHWIESYPDFKTRFSELVDIVAQLVGVVVVSKESKKTVASISTPETTPETVSVSTHERIKIAIPTSTKQYKVGDYYDDGVKRGVVFDVWDGGRHGKIVNMKDSGCVQWAVDKNFGTIFRRDNPVNQYNGLTAKKNGLLNQRIIMKLPRWREKYPAFALCADMGDGWYLPAVDELYRILHEVYDPVNRTLKKYNGDFWTDRSYITYWSSTENEIPHSDCLDQKYKDQYCVEVVNRIDISGYVNSITSTLKWRYEQVRAVATF